MRRLIKRCQDVVVWVSVIREKNLLEMYDAGKT